MIKKSKKVTWKAILAVVLVMATLFAMSSLVNAEFVEEILGEEYTEVMTASSSSIPGVEDCQHYDMVHVSTKSSTCYRCGGAINVLEYECPDCGISIIKPEHKCTVYY